MERLIVPAIIAETQDELYSMISKVRRMVKRIMLDIMDGEFLPNTSLNFDLSLQAGPEYEAHLMVDSPLEWVKQHADKVDIAILHVETLDCIKESIDYVRSKELNVILAINPETEIDSVFTYLDDIDGVLVMTVDPGRYGGSFLPETLVKVKQLREIDDTIPIEVDGGINPINARLARDSGANIFASGSYILKSNDIEKSIKELEKAVK
jgi:ribulose-phosphate 3-epimerase